MEDPILGDQEMEVRALDSVKVGEEAGLSADLSDFGHIPSSGQKSGVQLHSSSSVKDDYQKLVSIVFGSRLSGAVTSFFGVAQLILFFVVIVLLAVLLSKNSTNKDIDAINAQLVQIVGKLDAVSMSADEDAKRQISLENLVRSVSDYNLPHRYLVEPTYLTPTKSQVSRGTCWDFATIAMLEALYNHIGAQNGFLESGKVVQFSEQVYGERLVQVCATSKDERVVNLCGGRNDTEGGIPEWIYYLQEYLVQGINGISVCPYQQQKKDWDMCPKYEDATNPETNPISFNITGIEYSSDLTEIKRQLVSLQTPATWASFLVKQTINILCKDLPIDTEKCAQIGTVCDIGNGIKEPCIPHTIDSFNARGEFYQYGTPQQDEGHAQLLVGYNDDMIVNKEPFNAHLDVNRIDSYTSGGVILKNSWGSDKGHTAMYWSGNWTKEQDERLCPNSHNPEKWDVLQNFPYYVSKPSETVPWVSVLEKGLTILQCAHPSSACFFGFCGDACSDDYYYALISEVVVPMDIPAPKGYHWVEKGNTPGMYTVHMVKFPKESNRGFIEDSMGTPPPEYLYGTMTTFESNETMWNNFHNVFSPVSQCRPDGCQILPKNDPDHCGYFFMTYDLLKQSALRNGMGYATHYHVDFDDCSYEFNKDIPQCDSKDYSYIHDSTTKFAIADWIDPTGWMVFPW